MTFETTPPLGGEMEITPLTLVGGGQGEAWPKFHGLQTDLRCDTGRSALQLVLRDWYSGRRVANPRIWIPDFLCGSVARIAEHEGYRVRRYLDIPSSSGRFIPPEPGESDLVLVVHYFGFKNRPLLEWLNSQSDHSWGVIEDCVQAPYTGGVGDSGDYAIASLRKWWPTPDGAAAWGLNDLSGVNLADPDEKFVSQRWAAQLLRGTRSHDEIFLKWIAMSEQLLSSNIPRRCSWIAETLLAGANPDVASGRRRDNWRQLQQSFSDGLIHEKNAAPLYTMLDPGAVPLAFPICITNGRRDRLRTALAAKRIYAPVHWLIDQPEYAETALLSSQILSLPLDQRYGVEDMNRIIQALIDWFSED